MAAERVVVQNLDSLEAFGRLLAGKEEELLNLYDILVTSCAQQGSNWQDPQYDYLRARLETYARNARGQLEDLKGASDYIARLVYRLRGI